MKSFSTMLNQWNTSHSSFSKLQHAYITIALAALVAAGIIGLINYNLGQSILFVAATAALVFIGNGVVWALMRTFIVARVEKPAQPRKK